MNVDDVLTGAKTVLEANTSSVTVLDHAPQQVNPPTIVVSWTGGRPYEDFDGGGSLILAVTVIAAKADSRSAQSRLQEWAYGGTKDITAAIPDTTLNSTCDSIAWGGYELVTLTVANIDYIGVEFALEVYG